MSDNEDAPPPPMQDHASPCLDEAVNNEEEEEKVEALERVLDFVHIIETQIAQNRERWNAYNLHTLTSLFFGLFLILFGRNVIISYTVLEAFRLGQVSSFMEHLSEMNQRRKRKARERRARRIPTKQELVQKFSQTAMTVISVLQWNYAASIALGISLGEDLFRFTVFYLLPRALERNEKPMALDEVELQDKLWWLSRAIGIVFAFIFYNVIQVITTSTRGAFMVATVVQDKFKVTDQQFEYLVGALSAGGMLFQSFAYVSLPTPVKAIFLPAYVSELVWGKIKQAMWSAVSK